MEAKEEGNEEVGEDEGEAEDDPDKETKTRKEAIRSCRDKGFKLRHKESELCHAMCCIACPLKGPCGPCSALAKVRRDTFSKGQRYVDLITLQKDHCPHCTDFKPRGA